jgi:Putative Ig domain
MTAVRRLAVGLFACAVIFLLGGCGSGSGQITITLTTQNGILSVDESDPTATPPFLPTLNFTAAVGGDTSGSGVTWELKTQTGCSGNGTGVGECGTLTNLMPFSATYTPPSGLAASLTVTLTATSIASSSVTRTATITVVLPPTFTLSSCNPPNPPLDSLLSPCILPTGQNGVPYISSSSNQVTVAFTGGVPPYSYSQPSLPACLSMTTSTTSTTATISGTPCGSGTTTFSVTVTDNTNNPSAAAPPISQTYQITINPPPPLSLLATPLPAGQVNAAYSASVVAQGGVPPLTWTLAPANSLPPGIAFNSSTGQFNGVPTAASATGSSCSPAQAGIYCFTVQVQDSALPTHQTAPATPLPLSITIRPPPPLQITSANLPSGATATGYTGPLNATGGVPPYTWSVAAGQLPAGLALTTQSNGTGSITGTPILAGTSNFTVAVTDSEIPAVTKTASFSITIVANANSMSNDALLQGSYAFLFSGFDTNGSVLITGQITADGKGNITAGTENANRISGIVVGATVTGTYTIGSDGRGVMELISTFANQAPLTEDYELVLNSTGGGYFFEDNSTKTNTDGSFHTHGEGTLKSQLGSGFANSDFAGHYAFLFSGQDISNKPAALGGVIVANGTSSTLLPGTGDFNDAGTLSSAATITGTFGGISGNQGTASLTFPLANGQTTLNFVFLFVSPSELYFMECDSNSTTGICAAGTPALNRLGGEMILQNPGVVFGPTALQGTSVATGIAVNSSGNSDVFAGLMTATTCDGSTSVGLSYDENSGGTVTSSSFSGTCTIGLSGNGRAVFASLGPSAAQAHVATAYLTGAGTGLLLGSDAAVTTGLLEQQSGGPSFSNASVLGSYALGTPFVVEAQMKNVIGQVTGNGTGNLSGVVDAIDSPATGPPNLAQPFSATFVTLAPSGRGTLLATATVPVGMPTTGVFYIVSPSSFRMISTDSSDQHPNLLLFDH